MASGGNLPRREDEVGRHLNGARAAHVQEARDVTAAHSVLRGELRGAGAQQLRQRPPRCLQRVGVFHQASVMQVCSQLQCVLQQEQQQATQIK